MDVTGGHIRTLSSGLLSVTVSVVVTVSVTMCTDRHLHRRQQHSKKKKRAGRSILSCPVLSSASIVVVERDRSWCTRVVTEAEDDNRMVVNAPGTPSCRGRQHNRVANERHVPGDDQKDE